MNILKFTIFILIIFFDLYLFLNNKIYTIQNKTIICDDSTEYIYNCYFQIDSICKDGYTLKVIGCYINDSINSSGNHMFNQIPVNQILSILKDDSVIYSAPHPANLVFDITSSGKIILVMEHKIVDIGIAGEGEKILFDIQAYAGNNSIQFSQIFNTKGELVFFIYSNRNNINIHFGDLLELLKNHNIEYETYRTRNFLTKTIIPKPR